MSEFVVVVVFVVACFFFSLSVCWLFLSRALLMEGCVMIYESFLSLAHSLSHFFSFSSSVRGRDSSLSIHTKSYSLCYYLFFVVIDSFMSYF